MADENGFRLDVSKTVSGSTALCIFFGKVKLARLTFNMSGGFAQIGIIKKFPIDSKVISKFRKEFGAFPSEYLLDELSRRGAKGYRYHSLNPGGKRLLTALIKRKVVQYNVARSEIWHEYALTNEAHSRALRRKRLP